MQRETKSPHFSRAFGHEWLDDLERFGVGWMFCHVLSAIYLPQKEFKMKARLSAFSWQVDSWLCDILKVQVQIHDATVICVHPNVNHESLSSQLPIWKPARSKRMCVIWLTDWYDFAHRYELLGHKTVGLKLRIRDGRDMSCLSEKRPFLGEKTPEDIRRPQSGTSEHCGVTVPWPTTCKPLTKNVARLGWGSASLLSRAAKYMSLSPSLWLLLGKIFCTGSWRKVEKMWLVERPGIEHEKKLQSCSTSSASDGAIFHGAISESISRTSKILRLCRHLWSSGSCYRSSGSCFSCGMSTSLSLYLHMFWHMTRSSPKLGLTNSRCFAHWQHKI